MKESPHHLLQENTHLRTRIAELEAEVARLKGQKGDEASLLPRTDFIREIARMVAHDERYGGTSSLLVFSFEGLEAQKKQLGGAYDKLMHMAGACLLRHVRACDIVGQTGAEDFSILLTRCAIGDAEKKAELLASKIKESVDPVLPATGAITLRYVASILNAR